MTSKAYMRLADLDLVALIDIAERTGYAYVTIRKWWTEEGMPEPLAYVQVGRVPLWDWEDVVAWMDERGKRGPYRRRSENPPPWPPREDLSEE